MERDDGFRGVSLVHEERDECTDAHKSQSEYLPRAPRIGVAAPDKCEQKCRCTSCKQRRSHVVDAMVPAFKRNVEGKRGYEQGGQPDGQVDVEDPAPRQIVRQEPAQQRANDACEGEHRAQVALIAPPLPRRQNVTDDRHGQRDQPTCAQPLQRPEHDQLHHVLSDPAQGGTDQEDQDRGLEDLLAAVDVADLSVQRHRHRRGQHVGRHHPRQAVDTTELADDAQAATVATIVWSSAARSRPIIRPAKITRIRFCDRPPTGSCTALSLTVMRARIVAFCDKVSCRRMQLGDPHP